MLAFWSVSNQTVVLAPIGSLLEADLIARTYAFPAYLPYTSYPDKPVPGTMSKRSRVVQSDNPPSTVIFP